MTEGDRQLRSARMEGGIAALVMAGAAGTALRPDRSVTPLNPVGEAEGVRGSPASPLRLGVHTGRGGRACAAVGAGAGRALYRLRRRGCGKGGAGSMAGQPGGRRS